MLEQTDLKKGTFVRSKDILRELTDGMAINPIYTDARKPATDGELVGPFPGHGGDVWAVRQNDDEIAAYCYDELIKREGNMFVEDVLKD